jgi:fructokinase
MKPAANLPRFVVFGEALTDMIRQPDGRWLALPGGSCWNVARVAARQGTATGFAGSISDDLFGDELATQTQAAGVDLRFLQRVHAAPLLAIVASSDPPRYFFIGEKSADLAFDPTTLPAGWREAVSIVHFGGISLARWPLADRLVKEARAVRHAGKRVAFDPNFREPMRAPAYGELFRTMVSLAHYIKVSEEDLEALFPGTGVPSALATLREMAPLADILLTRGARGMALLQASQMIEQAALKVDVVDTVGCGDAAMGGWISAVLQDEPAGAAQHLKLAAACAALAATHVGPYAASAQEVVQLMAPR